MSVQILVSHKDITIRLKDITGFCVCTRCKGAREVVRVMSSGKFPFPQPGVYYAGEYVRCPQCHGEGYWKTLH